MRTKLTGIPIYQNEQEFIIVKIAIKDILRLTRYTQRLIIGYDEKEMPIYNKHIQRNVESLRVNRIADYLINDKDATFPTNIVLGIPINIIDEQKEDYGNISIFLNDKVEEQVNKYSSGDLNADIYITIIDGQHRIRGIEIAIERLYTQLKNGMDIEVTSKKLENLLNIELVVSYFIDKSLEYQAMIFSTINRTQKRVSQDLVHSLFGLSTDDTPYKTALEVVLALNGHSSSPFYKRVRLYGGDYKRNESPPLSQATMIKNIVALISESLSESENDKYRKRKELARRNNNKFLPFREFYANNEDYNISNCLFYFFNSVKNHFPNFWLYDGKSKPTNILQSTIGFESLLKLLVSIIEEGDISRFDSYVFDEYIDRIIDIDFGDVVMFPMTTSSKRKLYNEMYVRVFPDGKKCHK